MSRGRRFLLFLNNKCLVTLSPVAAKMRPTTVEKASKHLQNDPITSKKPLITFIRNDPKHPQNRTK